LPNQFCSSLSESFEVGIELPDEAASGTFGRKLLVLSAPYIQLN
jgi:hypothetical protein